MRILFNIVEITRDRRTKAQLSSAAAIDQTRTDLKLEQLWRERVKANISARLNRRVEQILQSGVETPAFLRRQAE